jgi:hypothetical protein
MEAAAGSVTGRPHTGGFLDLKINPKSAYHMRKIDRK